MNPVQIDIIPFESMYREEFKSLNLEWLDAYNLTESHDLEVLENPEETILERGGVIYLARNEKGIIVGTAALMKEKEGVYELAKMAVSPGYRGMGISKKLLDVCIREAKARKALRIRLFSNHQLLTAIRLYESFGFRHIPVTGSPFETADVKMELIL